MSDERHGSNTEQERRIREAIRSTGDVRADASFRERLKREFVVGTIDESSAVPERTSTRGFPRWTWALVPVAAAVLLFAILLPRTPEPPTWSVQAARGTDVVEVDGRPIAADQAELLAQALASGGEIRLPDSLALDLRLGDYMIVALAEGAEVTLPALPAAGSAEPMIARVHDGEIRIKTGPAFPGTEMHIVTDDGRSQITGTILSVYKYYDFTCVCLLEGTALVGVDESLLEEISEGWLKVMYGEGYDSIVAGISGEHEVDLLEFEERYRHVFDSSK